MTYDDIVQFHGHECPGLAIGYRMATAAMEALESFRAEDEELVAIVENDACGVDALVRGIYCSATTESTFIPYTPDHHVWVSVCIFTEIKFQKAYTKTESP
jgi:hypothetical protein